MSNELFNQMLSAYDLATHQQKRNATFEVNQQIILAGLYNGGFFNEAAFYGYARHELILMGASP